jgi:BMFP domain-containing protein YqiC
MIPPFNESGFLPPGVHRATLSEIAARVGVQSELRRVQMESVRWMVELAKQEELRKGLPFLDIALVDREEFDELVEVTFATDRFRGRKGMIEVIAWN